MALTVNSLAVALRLSADPSTVLPAATTSILIRLLSTSKAVVNQYAPDAPTTVKDEACVRTAAVLYDQLQGGYSFSGMAAARNGGALALLSPWKVRRIWGSE